MLKNFMQPLLSLFFLLFVGVFLSGCASDGGFMSGGDYATYTKAHSDHATAESNRITAQAGAISNAATGSPTTTRMESTLLAVIAMMQIERLQPTPLTIARPITGYDVLEKLVGHVPLVASVGGMYGLGRVGIENAGQVTVAAGATLDNALNRTSVTAAGTDTGVTYTGTAPAQVVEPTIIEVPTP